MTTGLSANHPMRSVARALEERSHSAGNCLETPAHGVGRTSSSPPGVPFRVRNVMTRNVRHCRSRDTLASAAAAMCEADCRFLPVVDEKLRPIGVLTDGDICLIGSTCRRRLSDMYVADAMSPRPVTCHADDDVLEALRLMRGRRIRHLPVVGPEGSLEGVVSLTDLVLCAEEAEVPVLRRELAEALRELIQKYGDRRVIDHNPFVEED